MAVELRSVAADGNPDAILPDWTDLSFNQDFDPGALSFTYALTGRGANLLDHGTEIVTLLDGVEPADARFMVNQAQGTNLAEQDASATRTYSLPSLRSKFANLVIGPSLSSTSADTTTTPPYGPGVWVGVTAGQLLIEAIQYGIVRAQTALGLSSGVNPLTWLTWPITSFTSTHDSSGAAWPAAPLIDYTADQGSTVADVVQFLSDGGFANIRMQGHELQAYTPTNFGTDRSGGSNPVVLITGRDFTDASYQTDSSELVNALLVIGGIPPGATAPACKWVYDIPSINQFGYREGSVTVSTVTTQPVLQQIGTQYLSYMKTVRWSYTYSQAAGYLEQATNPIRSAIADSTLPFLLPSYLGTSDPDNPATVGTFRPFIDYTVGDTILIMDGSEFIADKVRALAATWPTAQSASVALTINDFFAEREALLDQRLKRIGA